MSGGFLEVLGPAAPAWRQKMVRRRYGKDEPIFHEGEAGDTFHVIDKGRVLIEVSTARGDVAALGVRGPGEVLGELAIVGAGRRTAKVTALEPTETLALTRATLDEMRRADPNVDQRLLQILAARLQETMDQLMEVLFISVETRVLRVLLRLAEAFDSNTTPIIVRVRQEDIAAMAGTRRQTANRPLKAAEAKGAIKIGRGRIEIVDLALLQSLAE
ncbi:MAG: CRP/FNR family cyclic AMP-dependent transcriptional regulator [Candidatus Aldehydirespiratoraceae bacterium]|jgi:CRP/FNR family cyclic AMP-dependent transcriptional regulator